MPQAAPYSTSRVLKAPRDLVFLAATDPVHLIHWYGPAGTTVLRADVDLRVGGCHHYGLRTPDGGEMWGKQVYREIVRPEKLVYLQSFSDRDGGIARHPMAPTWPLQMLSTLTFEALADGTTRLTVTWQPFECDDAANATFDGARAGMAGGFKGMFDNLEAHLAATACEISQSRLVDAPREKIWTVLTDAKHLDRFWGPDGFENTTYAHDPRVGGVWRFDMRGPDGKVWPNHMLYRELTPPERIAYDHGDGESVHFQASITLKEEAGKTRVTFSVRMMSQEARDGSLKFGAVAGGQQNLAKLAAYVQGL